MAGLSPYVGLARIVVLTILGLYVVLFILDAFLDLDAIVLGGVQAALMASLGIVTIMLRLRNGKAEPPP